MAVTQWRSSQPWTGIRICCQQELVAMLGTLRESASSPLHSMSRAAAPWSAPLMSTTNLVKSSSASHSLQGMSFVHVIRTAIRTAKRIGYCGGTPTSGTLQACTHAYVQRLCHQLRISNGQKSGTGWQVLLLTRMVLKADALQCFAEHGPGRCWDSLRTFGMQEACSTAGMC